MDVVLSVPVDVLLAMLKERWRFLDVVALIIKLTRKTYKKNVALVFQWLFFKQFQGSGRKSDDHTHNPDVFYSPVHPLASCPAISRRRPLFTSLTHVSSLSTHLLASQCILLVPSPLPKPNTHPLRLRLSSL